MTISGDLERALEVYRGDQEIPPGFSAIVRAALREYLAERGYMKPREGEIGAEPLRGRGDLEKRPWPRYPLYSGDPTLAERAEEELAGGPESPSFGER